MHTRFPFGRRKTLHDVEFGLCVLASAPQKPGSKENRLCVRTRTVPLEKNAVWTMQCDGYFSAIDGPGSHKFKQDV